MLTMEGLKDSKIMIVGDLPSTSDLRENRHFTGTTGRILDSLLNEAGTSRVECLLTNVIKDNRTTNNTGLKVDFFYEDTKLLQPKPVTKMFIEQLRREILEIKPNIIIALGHIPMHTLTDQIGITKYRGYVTDCTLVPGIKVIPTYHPSQIIHDWKLAFQFIMDVRKAVAVSKTALPIMDTRVLETRYGYNQMLDYLDWLYTSHQGKIAVDIETVSPGSHIDIIGFSHSPDHAVSFQILRDRLPLYTSEQEYELWRRIRKVMQEKEIVMHNGLYDSAVILHHYGFWCTGYKYDTLIAAHACFPECPRSLSFLASICLNVPSWKQTQYTDSLRYNAADAANTLGIWDVLESQMSLLGTRQTHDFEMEQTEIAVMLQLQGITIDKDKQRQEVNSLTARLSYLKEEVNQDVGKKINLASPKQLADLLYKDMQLPVQYNRKANSNGQKTVTTNEETLVKLSRMTTNPVLKKIMEAKKIMKLLTFIDIETSVHSTVHTCYNITGATMLRENKGIAIDDEDAYKSFGRWSSSASIILPYGSGNLQNVPGAARKIYVPPSGHVFVQADYKQAEAVVVAFLIGDNRSKKLFRDSFGLSDKECKERNLDIHKLTAAMMFNQPIESITPDQRKIGKTIRHAMNYSAGPGVLAVKLNIQMKEAKKLIQLFHNATPQLQLWHLRIQDELKRTRNLTNLFGRKHKFIDRWGDSLFRSAYAYIPQSTVGDLLNRALIRLYKNYGNDLHIALQLHDAIYVAVPEDKVDFAKSALRDSMIMPLTCNGEEFFIDIDFKVGKTWGDLEED